VRVCSKKRGCLLAGAVTAAGAAVAACALIRLPAAPGITEANFNRLTEGMAEAEVERILGGAPGDYNDGTAVHFPTGVISGGLQRKDWLGNRGRVQASFRDGRLVDKHFLMPYVLPRPTWLDRVRWFCRDLLGR